MVILEERLARNKDQWKFSLIEKFLDHKVLDPEFLARTLCQRWKTKGSNDIIPMINGFLMFKFNYEEDKIIKTEGPWSMSDTILTLEDWRKNFWPSKAVISKVTMWM